MKVIRRIQSEYDMINKITYKQLMKRHTKIQKKTQKKNLRKLREE